MFQGFMCRSPFIIHYRLILRLLCSNLTWQTSVPRLHRICRLLHKRNSSFLPEFTGFFKVETYWKIGLQVIYMNSVMASIYPSIVSQWLYCYSVNWAEKGCYSYTLNFFDIFITLPYWTVVGLLLLSQKSAF